MRKGTSADLMATFPAYQPCKLYVKFPIEVLSLHGFESKLEAYFSQFGFVLDIKILENSWFISAPKNILLRIFSRGRILDRSSEQRSLFRRL